MSMANKGLNKVRVGAGDVPNIGSVTNSNSYKPAIRGEAAVFGITTGHLELNQSFGL